MEATISRLSLLFGHDKDDIRQDIYLKEEHIKSRYNGSVPYELYVFVCMRNHYAQIKPRSYVELIDVPYRDQGSDRVDASDEIIAIRAMITDEEYDLILRRYGYDETATELAREAGVTRQAMSARILNIIKKIRKGRNYEGHT